MTVVLLSDHVENIQAQAVTLEGGACVLGGRGAAEVVGGVGGGLGGARQRVAADSAVQMDHSGLGGHGGVVVLC